MAEGSGTYPGAAPAGLRLLKPAVLLGQRPSLTAYRYRHWNHEMSSQRDNITKEYATEEVVVVWEPRLCYHSQNCVRSLPQVFDDTRRPWVKVDAATADEVEAAVALCPSGALRTRRVGVPTAPRRQPLELSASADGPLLVSGSVRILDAEGRVLYEGERAALCRCGGSANKPFCDGTHKKNGFHG